MTSERNSGSAGELAERESERTMRCFERIQMDYQDAVARGDDEARERLFEERRLRMEADLDRIRAEMRRDR